MTPFICASAVWVSVVLVVLSLFRAHGPQDRKQMKVGKDWKPVSELYKGRR